MQIQKQIEEAVEKIEEALIDLQEQHHRQGWEGVNDDEVKRANKETREIILQHLTTIATKSADQAVLNYILSLGWQDTENEYVKEVLSDAEKLAQALSKPKIMPNTIQKGSEI